VKLAIFSDIHGNIFYFRSCLSKMAEYKVDKYIFLGDAVGYMSYASDVLNELDSINADCLMGNHEAMLCNFLDYSNDKDEIYKLKQAILNVPDYMIEKIKTWLPYKIVSYDKANVLLVHGSPWNPLFGYIYPDSPERHYNNPQYDFVFTGHTHRPFISRNTHTTVVNVGSVGLPRDFGNKPSFAIWDSVAKETQIIRIGINNQELLLDLKKQNVHKDVIACLSRNQGKADV